MSGPAGGVIRIGTRGSALAVAQARLAADALTRHGASCELVEIVTAGDVRAPDTAWGEGAFVGAIEAALLEGRIDMAVHSAKDMPTDMDPRLAVVAYLRRADARDALVLRAGAPAVSLADLPPGSVIGTDSPRRAGFLRAARPDIDVQPLHGNVDTRLHRLDEGRADALVLAAAGLERLGRGDRIGHRFEPAMLPPAPGQGAIALQARAGDARLATLAQLVDDSSTRHAVEAERELLAATGGGCRAPVGALATVHQGELRLLAGFASLDGSASAIESIVGPLESAGHLARELACRLVARRAEMASGPAVLLTRPADQSARLAALLAAHGLRALVVPAIEIVPVEPRAVEAELRHLRGYSWVVVTSRNGARAAVVAARQAGIDLADGRWAALGKATAQTLRMAGVAEVWQPSEARSAAIGDELPIGRRTTVLLLRGDLADEELPRRLVERGAEVRSVVAYSTHEAPASSVPLLDAALAGGPPAVVVLASPSAVRGLLTLAGEEGRSRLLALPALCIGRTTGSAAREHGFARVIESERAEIDTLATTAAELVAGSSLVGA